jgi:glycosyltransferase involved in cell wall biosynthesis
MKIGLLVPPWLPVPPPSYGGTEAVVDRLARGFAARGHDVLLWSTGDSTCPVPTGWRFDRARPEDIGDMSVELEHVRAGYEAMVTWGADVIHDHTLSGPGFSGVHAHCPVVTTCHGPFDSVLGDLYRQISTRVPVVAISHDQASRAEGIRVQCVIHHGIDVEEIPVGDGVGDERGPYLLHVGRMCADKGIPNAIGAARRAGQRLVIAAKMREPLEHQYFRTCVEPLLGHGVEYVGEVDQQRRNELMGAATALLNPIQWHEPFGLVMIEAMACGTPVIALRKGAVPEIVDEGVTGFVRDDEAGLVEAIERVGSLDRAVVRSTVAARFDTMRMVDQHVALFEELVRQQRVA